MVYDSQKLRRKRVERLVHNGTFKPNSVQISKSYILNLDSIIHLHQGAKKDADIKINWIKIISPIVPNQILIGIELENMIFSRCVQSATPILIVMPAEERWHRLRTHDPKFFVAQIQIQIPNKYLGFGYKVLDFL